MRSFSYLILFVLSTSAFAAGLMDKKTFIDTVDDTMVSTMCSKDYNQCLGVSKASCTKEVKKLIDSQCASGVPDEIQDMDEIRSVSASLARCVSTAYLKKHKIDGSKASCKKIVQ